MTDEQFRAECRDGISKVCPQQAHSLPHLGKLVARIYYTAADYASSEDYVRVMPC